MSSDGAAPKLDLGRASIKDIVDALSAGSVTSVQLVDGYLGERSFSCPV